MSKDALLEIGVEELPARFIPGAIGQLEEMTKEKLKSSRIEYDKLDIYATPRRLAILIRNISDNQSDEDVLLKGPSKKAAFDAQGNPTRALEGFLRSNQAQTADISVDKVGDIEYIFLKKHAMGKPTFQILQSLFPEIIRGMNFAKSMRWGVSQMRFARPIRWVVSLLGDKIVPFELEEIKFSWMEQQMMGKIADGSESAVRASNVTMGHRTLANHAITVTDASKYPDIMKDGFVMADHGERKAQIVKQIEKIATQKNASVNVDPELLEEVTFLVEYPTALVGAIEEEFLALPAQAIITPMKEHQRYFPLMEGEKLLPYFITIRNGGEKGLDIVRAGNEKVLRARLKDAQFFYQEDLKEPLERKVDKLKTIVYQVKLGTIYEKVERFTVIALHIAKLLSCSDVQLKILSRSAYLCKADLVTGMVNEFDELQGIMGREYARVNREPAEVSTAIYSHYLPRFSGDETPKDLYGAILSIADKMDSVAGSFSIGVVPTGSQDPYGLRRQAIGILNVMMEMKLNIDFKELLMVSLQQLKAKTDFDANKVFDELVAFFKQRLRIMFIDEGYRFDLVDAVLENHFDAIHQLKQKIEILSRTIRENKDFEPLITAITRSNNIAKKFSGKSAVNAALFENDAEGKLFEKVEAVQELVEKALAEGKYETALQSLVQMVNPIHQFFEQTMVMVENQELKQNRLALLSRVNAVARMVFDFEKVVMG